MRPGGRRTFSLSSPSWVVPGTYLENVEALSLLPEFDSVELLFFSYDDDAKSLLEREMEGLLAMRDRFEYTLHLPDPLLPEHEGLIAATRKMVSSYVFHPSTEEPVRLVRLIDSWRRDFGDVFHLENTDKASFQTVSALFDGIGICCDTGRILLAGEDPSIWIAKREGQVKEMHLHGVREGKDHEPFVADEPWIERLKPFLSHFTGIVELEIFDLGGLTSSAAELEKLCE